MGTEMEFGGEGGSRRGLLLSMLVLLGTLASADASEDKTVAPGSDSSWGNGYHWDNGMDAYTQDEFKDGMLREPTDADPPTRTHVVEQTAEEQFVDKKVQQAKAKMLGTKSDCTQAHEANQYACDAYGEHSPVCTGAQTQYVLQCGSITPRPLFHKAKAAKKHLDMTDLVRNDISLIQEEDIDSALLEQEPSGTMDADAIKEAAEKNKPESLEEAMINNATVTNRPDRTLEGDLEPVLLACQVKHDAAKLQCKKNVVAGYLTFKEANADPSDERAKEEYMKEKSELGDTVELNKLYQQAMSSLKKAKLGLPEVHPITSDSLDAISSAFGGGKNPNTDITRRAVQFAQQDQMFAETDPAFREKEVEEMAVGSIFPTEDLYE